MDASHCDICRRPTGICVCDRVVSLQTERRVLILQHPQEQDELLGTAQLLCASLPRAELVIGLSWRNLGHALGDPNVDPDGWAVLFPDPRADGPGVISRSGKPVPPGTLQGIIVLDGTWSQAKTLWWRNPWLSRMRRMTLRPEAPSIYGRLRAEPRREYVSTLESAAAALTLCGESPEIEAQLRRLFRTLVQRARDAAPKAEDRRLGRRPARRPKAERPPR